MNNPNLSEMINDDDEGAFQYLSNLVVVEYEDVRSGYKISFVSSSNKHLLHSNFCRNGRCKSIRLGHVRT